MIRPGPLSPADANYLNEQLGKLEILQRRVESQLGQKAELIPAAVTSATTVAWLTVLNSTVTSVSAVQHGWYEEGFSPEGTRTTLVGGRSGSATLDLARMPDGSAIGAATPTSPVHCWIRETGLAATSGVNHEVIALVVSQTGLVGLPVRVFLNSTMVSFTGSSTWTTLFADTTLTSGVYMYYGNIRGAVFASATNQTCALGVHVMYTDPVSGTVSGNGIVQGVCGAPIPVPITGFTFFNLSDDRVIHPVALLHITSASGGVSFLARGVTGNTVDAGFIAVIASNSDLWRIKMA